MIEIVNEVNATKSVASLYGKQHVKLVLIREMLALGETLLKTILHIKTPKTRKEVIIRIAQTEIALDNLKYVLRQQEAVEKARQAIERDNLRRIKAAGIKL